MPTQSRWQTAQRHEANCWHFHAAKLNHPQYAPWKRACWEAYCDRIGLTADVLGSRPLRIADYGCGPSGLLLYIAEKAAPGSVMVGIDPLMNEYLEIFAPLRELPVEWVQSPAEEFVREQAFDLVFSANSIDHCRQIDAYVDCMHRSLAPSGTCWISINCYQSAWRARMFRTLDLDPMHPIHFTQAEYSTLFATRFREVGTRDVTLSLLKVGAPPPPPITDTGDSLVSRVLRNLTPRNMVRIAVSAGQPENPTTPDSPSLCRSIAFELQHKDGR